MHITHIEYVLGACVMTALSLSLVRLSLFPCSVSRSPLAPALALPLLRLSLSLCFISVSRSPLASSPSLALSLLRPCLSLSPCSVFRSPLLGLLVSLASLSLSLAFSVSRSPLLLCLSLSLASQCLSRSLSPGLFLSFFPLVCVRALSLSEPAYGHEWPSLCYPRVWTCCLAEYSGFGYV
eukprot:1329663-Amorphochlora_amoeboformis.AAC.1